MSEPVVHYRGLGLAGTLQVVFIILKLVGVIHWSWWWVLAPLWIEAAVGALFLLAGVAVLLYFSGK